LIILDQLSEARWPGLMLLKLQEQGSDQRNTDHHPGVKLVFGRGYIEEA